MAENDRKNKQKGLDDLSYYESLSSPIPRPNLANDIPGATLDTPEPDKRTKRAQPDQLSP